MECFSRVQLGFWSHWVQSCKKGRPNNRIDSVTTTATLFAGPSPLKVLEKSRSHNPFVQYFPCEDDLNHLKNGEDANNNMIREVWLRRLSRYTCSLRKCRETANVFTGDGGIDRTWLQWSHVASPIKLERKKQKQLRYSVFWWRRRKKQSPCVHGKAPCMSWCLHLLVTLVICRKASNTSLCSTSAHPLKRVRPLGAHLFSLYQSASVEAVCRTIVHQFETLKKQVRKIRERLSSRRDAMAFNKKKKTSLWTPLNNATSTPLYSTSTSAPVFRRRDSTSGNVPN